MTDFKDEITAWLRSQLTDDVQLDVVVYESSMAMINLRGKGLMLQRITPAQKSWHVFLHVHEGELRLTANDDRLGFEAPVYVDFLDGYGWKDVTFPAGFEACMVVLEQGFFMEGAVSLRSQVSGRMMYFAMHPFLTLSDHEVYRVKRLEELLWNTLEVKVHAFRREVLQTLICAWQYELWNIVFVRQQGTHPEERTRWNDIASHFLYLARTHCREHHEVGWYAARIGVSVDMLSATLKRLYGKTGNGILNDLLMAEAKVCLRNPDVSLQGVAEMLCFSDQSSFGKFFKRHCGMSPNAFRKRCAN